MSSAHKFQAINCLTSVVSEKVIYTGIKVYTLACYSKMRNTECAKLRLRRCVNSRLHQQDPSEVLLTDEAGTLSFCLLFPTATTYAQGKTNDRFIKKPEVDFDFSCPSLF